MDNDDALIGQVLTRREGLRLMGIGGAAGAALMAGCQPAQPTEAAPAQPAEASSTSPTAAAEAVSSAPAAPECVVRPELAEGPYFVDARLDRSDIRSDPATGALSAGVPLRLIVRTSRLDGTACTLFPGVTVDVWHCDAFGAYSGVNDPRSDAAEALFLRGYQVTDQNGVAESTTIYPGWYPGRAVHIHFKLRTDPDSDTGREFTSQWFFDEATTDVVHAAEPYAAQGYRNVLNEQDGIFRQAGQQMILRASPEGDGYVAEFNVAIDVT